MLVTQGKNLFPEEVEARLLAHPAIAQASVMGSARIRCAACVCMPCWPMAPGQTLPDGLALAHWCRATLEAYKAPRQWWWCWHGPWPQTRSGKTDHAAPGPGGRCRLPTKDCGHGVERRLAHHRLGPHPGGPRGRCAAPLPAA